MHDFLFIIKGDFSISTLIDTNPPAPAGDYWLGLFIIGKDGDNAVLAENWAVLTIGGSKGEKKDIDRKYDKWHLE